MMMRQMTMMRQEQVPVAGSMLQTRGLPVDELHEAWILTATLCLILTLSTTRLGRKIVQPANQEVMYKK